MLFDFDTTNAGIGFGSWGGVGFSKITNPDKSGINVSDNVGEYTYNGNDAGLENDLVNDATPLSPFDFSETAFIKVKVWVSKPVGVSIKLQNYPDYEFGVLKGTVHHISEISTKDGFYTIDVSLPEKLRTSYNKEIAFKQEMRGTADIITEDLRLMQRFFYQFNKIMKR